MACRSRHFVPARKPCAVRRLRLRAARRQSGSAFAPGLRVPAIHHRTRGVPTSAQRSRRRRDTRPREDFMWQAAAFTSRSSITRTSSRTPSRLPARCGRGGC